MRTAWVASSLMRHSWALPPAGVTADASGDPAMTASKMRFSSPSASRYSDMMGLNWAWQASSSATRSSTRRLAGEFVWVDGSGVVVFHQHVGEKAQVLIARAVEIVGVAHQVKTGLVVAQQRAIAQPLLEQPGRLLITGLGIHRIGLLSALQMHGVVPATLLQLGFQLRAYHVVGRANHRGKISHDGGVEAATTEGAQSGHCVLHKTGWNKTGWNGTLV